MAATLELILLLYGFLLGLKLALRCRRDLRQAGIVLAFLVVPAFAADLYLPDWFRGSMLQLFGTEINVSWAWRTFASILLGATLFSAGLSWVRRLRTGDEGVAFHRLFLKLGLVLIAVPIAVKFNYPDFNFGNMVTSAAVGSVVFGLALQKPLGNLFSGMSNEVDNVVQQGEFVQIAAGSGSGGPRGFVVAKTWRGLQIETLDGETVFVPNDQVFTAPVINFQRPSDIVRRRLYVSVSCRHPPAIVKETMHSVVARESAVLKDPAPLVRLKDFQDHGMLFEVCYWIHGMREDENIADRLRTAIWYAFKERAIDIAVPIRTITPIDNADRARFEQSESEHVADLAAVFAATEPFATHASYGDRQYLARNGSVQRFESGATVVRRGDPSDAMYIIRSGNCEVVLPDGHRVSLEAPGFFGDIGILHQTARTADVVAGAHGLEVIRLGRFAIEGLLARAPALRRELFQISDDRLEALLAKERVTARPQPPEKAGFGRSLRGLAETLRPW